MNCPKCNSPINEGDKFCQVCGNVLDNQQPAVSQPQTTAAPPQTPVVNEQPVVANIQQPMASPNVNYNNQPMNNAMPMNNQMNAIPQEPKKNNTVVMVLAAIIVILLAVVIYLFISSGNKEESAPEEKVTPTEPEKEEVVTVKYTETVVNGYKFQLPEGYHAELYEGEVMLYNNDMDFEAYVQSMDGNYDSINKETAKATFTSYGLTNVTYEEKTINNKKVLIFTGDYYGDKVEYIYIKYSLSKVVGAYVYYENANYKKDELYDILAKVEIESSTYSSTAQNKLPKVDMKSILE